MKKLKISYCELIDKYTILLIKNIKIKDEEKLKNVNNELNILRKYVNELNNKYDLQILTYFYYNYLRPTFLLLIIYNH